MEFINSILQAFDQKWNKCTILHFKAELLAHLQQDGEEIQEFFEHFNNLQTSIEMIDFVYEILEKYDMLRDKYLDGSKNNRFAERYRKQGDQAFGEGNFAEALQLYTKSLLYSKNGEVLARAYANRSAALFKLQMYDECCVDVDRAVASGYPKDQQHCLLSRKEKASSLRKEENTKWYEEPQINRRPLEPAETLATNKIEIVQKGKSRCRVVATEDISVGEIIAIETAYTFYVIKGELYHCHQCLVLCFNPIPCDSCSHVAYCSEQCKVEAFDLYHKHECAILYSLRQLSGNLEVAVLAVKMCFLQENSPSKELNNMLFNLQVDKFKSEMFHMALICSYILYFIKYHTDWCTGKNQEQENTFKDLLLAHLLLVQVQGTCIDEFYPSSHVEKSYVTISDYVKYESETVACAYFNLNNSFRHSCVPNVFPHHHGRKRVLRAFRSIPKGTECFISYGPTYMHECKEQRQFRLETQYHFICKCKACQEDWPALDPEGCAPLSSMEDIGIMYQIKNGNPNAMYDAVKRFNRQIKKLEKQEEPCFALVLYQQLLIYCFDLLGNKRPFA